MVGQKPAVERVKHVEVQIAHVAHGDGWKRYRYGNDLDRHLLRKVEKAAQYLGHLDGEHETGRDTDDGPYTPADRRPRLDHLRHSVK